MKVEKRWYTSTQAAEYSGITVRSLYRLAQAGVITSHKVGHRTRLYEKAELDAWIESQRESCEKSEHC